MKRYGRRRRYGRRKPKKGLASKTYVRKAIGKIKANIETKYLSTSEALTVDYNGVIRKLSGTIQGGADYQRVGDQITCRSITVRFAPTNTADTFNICRMILFRWTQDDNVTSPYASSILDSTGYTTAPLSGWFFDAMRAKKFKVLYDKSFDTNADLSVASNFPRKVHIKLNSKVNYFNATANGTGNIYMLLISDSSIAPHPIINYASQLFYVDC